MFRFILLALGCATLFGSPSVARGQDSPQRHWCDVANFSDFDTGPAFIDSVGPGYPDIARKAEIEGEVTLRLLVNQTGELECVDLLCRINPIVDKAAIRAAKSSKYAPATKHGAPANGHMVVTYSFSIEKWSKTRKTGVRDHVPALDTTPPLVSEVGLEVYRDSIPPRFEYRGVEFVGDISLKVYEECLDQISMRFQTQEVPHFVVHYLAFPDTKPDQYLEEGDLQIRTCTNGCEPGTHGRGRVFKFVNENGRYTLMENKGFTTIWAE